MTRPIHQYFMIDGRDRPNTEFEVPGNAISVYEVIRLMEAVPLFLEDHLERWKRSASLTSQKLTIDLHNISRQISRLSKANQVVNGNVKLVYTWHETKRSGSCLLYFIPHKYPSEEDYRRGVSVGLLRGERDNPNAKVDQSLIRRMADDMITAQEFYEVLLVDRNGYITEGSRSNFFLIKERELITPPSKRVLPGITRKKVLHIAGRLGVAVREELIRQSGLGDQDAAFLTGTSPGILPVSRIGSNSFSTRNALLVDIRDAYRAMVADYMQSFGEKP